MLRRLIPLTGLVAGLLIPASAQADVFCVPTPCSPGAPQPTLAAAMTAAAGTAGTDTVNIGAGTFNLGDGVNMDVDTEIVGAGEGQTILTANPANLGSITVLYGNVRKLSDLTIRLPSSSGAGNYTAQGIDLYGGAIEDVTIDAEGAVYAPGINNGAGSIGLIRSGTLKHLTVDIDIDKEVSGLTVGAVASTGLDLEDVKITAPEGIQSGPQANPLPVTVTARRLEIHSPQPLIVFDGFFELRDSLLDASSAPASSDPELVTPALQLLDGRPPDPAGAELDGVTVVGNGSPGAAAFSIDGQGAAVTTKLTAHHIVSTGFPKTVGYANYGSNPAAEFAYSVIHTGADAFVNKLATPGTLGLTLGAGNVDEPPLLNADYTLQKASPAVDVGGPDLIANTGTDLAGNTRIVDADGDNAAAVDAGAYELQYVADGAAVTIAGKRIKLNRRGVGSLPITCPPQLEQPGPCTGKLKLTTVKKVAVGKRKPKKVKLARSPTWAIPAGETSRIKLKFKPSRFALVEEVAKSRKALATVDVTDNKGETGVVTKKVKVKP